MIVIVSHSNFFLDNIVHGEKSVMRLTPCEAPTLETRPATTPPYCFRQVCGCCGVLCLPYNTEDLGDGADGLKSLSEKT